MTAQRHVGLLVGLLGGVLALGAWARGDVDEAPAAGAGRAGERPPVASDQVPAGHKGRKGYFAVAKLPFHLQHEFEHALSCNNVEAKATEIELGGQKQHAILQRPGKFGWGTITFFLKLNPKLVGTDVEFFTTVGWKGKVEGEVVFGIEVNGDVIIDGARSKKDTWAEIKRDLRVHSDELRVTLMLDSVRGNNNFSFWWGEPQLRPKQ